MPLDPNIPLTPGRVVRPSPPSRFAQAYGIGAAVAQRSRALDQQDRQLGQRDRALGLEAQKLAIEKEKTQIDAAVRAHKLASEREKRRAESVVLGAGELNRFFEDGTLVDPEGAQAYLERRKQSIDRHNELFPGDPVDSVQTDRALRQLEEDPAGLYDEVQRTLDFGQRIGVIKPTPEEKLALERNTPLGRLTEQLARTNLEKAETAVEKARREETEAAEKKAGRQAKQEAQADIVTAKVDKALDILNNESFVAGLGGQLLSSFGGTDARNLEAQLKTIRAALAFDSLQEMRANSPTGGALGQVSNIELSLLESAVAALDQAQTPDQLREQLLEVKDHYAKWRSAAVEGVIPEGTVIRNAEGERRVYRGGQWQPIR